MKILALRDVVPDGTGRVYRQSRTMAVVQAVVFIGIFGGAPFLWYYLGAPGWVQGLCGMVALLVVPLTVGDLRAKFRATNWVVWVRPDCLYVNFRSYQDKSADDAECVVRFEWPEIAEAARHVNKFTTPSGDGNSTMHSVHSLDLQLLHDDTAALAAAMRDDRKRKQPEFQRFGISSVSVPSHFAVSLPEPDRVRVAWRGGTGNWISPSLSHVLAELAGYIPTGETIVERRAHWSKLTDRELDDQVLELVQTGNSIDAVNLLVRGRDLTMTEARRFVDELRAIG